MQGESTFSNNTSTNCGFSIVMLVYRGVIFGVQILEVWLGFCRDSPTPMILRELTETCDLTKWPPMAIVGKT